MVKFSVASPLMIFESFPTLLPEASAVKSTLHYLYHNFQEIFSMTSSLDCFSFLGGLGRGGCHRSLEILSFSIITLQLLILLQKKLHCPNSHSSLDHGQSHHLFQPSTWIPSVGMEHRLQHDVQQRHGLWTSIQLPAAAQVTDINMALGDSIDHGHQNGLRQQHRPQTSSWTLVAFLNL